jgi:RNA polymerase sigma-70 factor (ECF subfamily)
MEPPMTDAGPIDQQALAAHRDYLYRFALAHLRDPVRAEDVVQETLLAAVESRSAFSGKAQVFRRQARETPLEPGEPDAEDFEDLYFDAHNRDHWRSFPQAWADPEQSFEQKRFWEVLDACSKLMPAQTARVFVMRELMGLETDEICKELGVSANNCWVMLYRARMSLRQCLEIKWFAEPR